MNASVSPIAVAHGPNLRIYRKPTDSEDDCDDVMAQTKKWVVSSKMNVSNSSFSLHSNSGAASGRANIEAFGPEPPLRETVNNFADCLSPKKPIVLSSNTSYVSSPQLMQPVRLGVGVQPVVLNVTSPPLSLRELTPMESSSRPERLSIGRSERHSIESKDVTKDSFPFSVSPACAVDSPPETAISTSPLQDPGSITARKEFYEDIIFRTSSKSLSSDQKEAAGPGHHNGHGPCQGTQTSNDLVQSPHYRVLMNSSTQSGAVYVPEGFQPVTQRSDRLGESPSSTPGPGGERRGDQLAPGPRGDPDSDRDPVRRLPNTSMEYLRLSESVHRDPEDEQWHGQVHGLRDQYFDDVVIWGSGGQNKTPSKPQILLPVNQRWQGSLNVNATSRSRDIDPTMLFSNGRGLSPQQTSRSTDSYGRASQASTSSLHHGSPGYDAPSRQLEVASHGESRRGGGLGDSPASAGSGSSPNWKYHSEYSNIMVWDEAALAAIVNNSILLEPPQDCRAEDLEYWTKVIAYGAPPRKAFTPGAPATGEAPADLCSCLRTFALMVERPDGPRTPTRTPLPSESLSPQGTPFAFSPPLFGPY